MDVSQHRQNNNIDPTWMLKALCAKTNFQYHSALGLKLPNCTVTVVVAYILCLVAFMQNSSLLDGTQLEAFDALLLPFFGHI